MCLYINTPTLCYHTKAHCQLTYPKGKLLKLTYCIIVQILVNIEYTDRIFKYAENFETILILLIFSLYT